MRKLLLFFFAFFFGGILLAQNVLPIGQWRAHLPYREGRYVTQSSSMVYYSTGWSVLLLDKAELSIERLSKVEGLSNVGIRLMEFNNNNETLIVVYDNSVIDLVQESTDERTFVTLNQIANFNNFVGEKLINAIDVSDDNTMYLAANYGVSQIDLERNEFIFTTFTGIEVLDVQIFDEHIYAATEEGIYRAPINTVNLDDFGNWVLLGETEGFPAVYTANSLEVYDGALYLGIDEAVYRYQNGSLSLFYERAGKSIEFLKTSGQHLYAYLPVCTPGGCSGGSFVYFNENGTAKDLPSGCFASANAIAEDQQGRIWIGDDSRDFRYLESTAANECTFLTFNSPFSIENRELTVFDNQLWLASGGVDQRFSARFIDHGFASFIDGNWTIYNRKNRAELKGENQSDDFRDDDLFDFITIAVRPSTQKVYAGSYTEGIIEFDPATDEMVLYNEKNSTLETANIDTLRSRVSGLAFDDDENLWVANHTARNNEPLSVLTNEGFWRSFRLSGACLDTDVRQLDVDENGFKWVIVGSDQNGVLVYDEAELDNPSDDRCRLFSANNSNLPTNTTNCLAVDLEGDVWVGTSEGIVIFECGASAFEPECIGSRRIVEQDGFNAYLLETEDVRTIAVDGANRKWVGTLNGLFLLSPSGEEEILRFEENNSPLFDDEIIDIAVNNETGEVFIGTLKGIQSYQGDATRGGRVNRATVEVFPNPVRPEYDGPIAIRGLARDANVKITDVNGKLVYETTANGGQAIWNGRDYNGRRASSGVYLIFATTNSRNAGFEDPDATVGKILLLN